MSRVTNEEIAAVADGSADQTTERRVVAAALLDPSVHERLRQLRRVEAMPILVAEDSSRFLMRAHRLRERMAVAARQVAREQRESYEVAPAARAGPVFGGAVCTLIRALETVRQSVTLPGLAPAAAASVVEELRLRRDLFLAEGVRIELQQLPGEGLQLRAFVDASGVPGGFAAQDADGVSLELDGLGTLIVALNAEGRGFADFVDLPRPRRAVALVGVTLVRRTS